MISYLRKPIFGSVMLIALVSTANSASRSNTGDVPDPSPGSVIRQVYGDSIEGEVSDDSTSSQLASYNGGHVVSLWYNYHFTLSGRQYYTGFTVLEPAEGSTSYSGVLFGHLTYVLKNDDGKPSWVSSYGDRATAEVPGIMRAPQIDDTRSPQTFITSDKNLVLAIPTTDFENGETFTNFTIFSFDPNKNDLGDYKSWTYLGTVAAGGENSANCGEGLPMPCVSSTGNLSFVAPTRGASKMPTIRVTLSGTEVAGPGETKTLGTADAVNYKINTTTKQYEQSE